MGSELPLLESDATPLAGTLVGPQMNPHNMPPHRIVFGLEEKPEVVD
jgi:hypothetical protein